MTTNHSEVLKKLRSLHVTTLFDVTFNGMVTYWVTRTTKHARYLSDGNNFLRKFKWLVREYNKASRPFKVNIFVYGESHSINSRSGDTVCGNVRHHECDYSE